MDDKRIIFNVDEEGNARLCFREPEIIEFEGDLLTAMPLSISHCLAIAIVLTNYAMKCAEAQEENEASNG